MCTYNKSWGWEPIWGWRLGWKYGPCMLALMGSSMGRFLHWMPSFAIHLIWLFVGSVRRGVRSRFRWWFRVEQEWGEGWQPSLVLSIWVSINLLYCSLSFGRAFNFFGFTLGLEWQRIAVCGDLQWAGWGVGSYSACMLHNQLDWFIWHQRKVMTRQAATYVK